MKAKKLFLALAGLSFCGAVYAAGTITTVLPDSDTLQWTDSKNLPGAKVAVLMGNPAKREPFIARIKLPADFTIPVHTHPVNEYDTVISGTYYFGSGDKINIEKVVALPAGSFVSIPARTEHYGLIKNETIIQVNGIGPWGMIYKKV